MNDIVFQKATLPALSPDELTKVYELEKEVSKVEQIPIVTHHLIHAGVYHRTILVPANSVLTGTLIKRSTTLIVSGEMTLYTGGAPKYLKGYHVLPGSSGRKQAMVTHEDTEMTMLFATEATTVAEAEREFTDDLSVLASRKDTNANVIVVTGE